MKKADATRERLLVQARTLMWARGYGAVPLREVAQAAGVDVALVSRYFGGKMGLFEATLEHAFDVPPVTDAAALVEVVVQIFVSAPRVGGQPSILQLLVVNGKDPEVGALVRDMHAQHMQARLTELLGSAERAALFMATILGFSFAEKSMQLDGIPPYDTPEYEAQLRHMLQAALEYGR